MNQFIIYTKNNCKYCSKAKSLMMKHGLEFVEYLVPNQATKDDILNKLNEAGVYTDIKTVPQIFNSNEYIGGYTELETYLGS